MNTPDDFNPLIYRDLNPDLSSLSEKELKYHYLDYGIKDNRQYKYSYSLPDDFSYEIYKDLNDDLKNLSNNQLKLHYLKYGIKENRYYKYFIPDDFNHEIYKYLNSDLSNLSEEELKCHYLNFGIKEKRHYKYNYPLPNDFNVDIYKKLNKDLSNLGNDDLIRHYLKYGKKENRSYKEYLVTVILPTLNRFDKFKITVERFLYQTFKNFQFIIIDDGSNNHIFLQKKKLIEEINDDRIFFCKNDTNLKIPTTLNKGLSLSSGQYITWISDDNLYYDNFLEILYDDKYDYIYSAWDFQVIFNNNPVSKKKKMFTDYKNIKTLLRDEGGNWNGSASFMWKTNFLKEIYGWNKKYHGIEDYEIIFKTYLYTTSIKKVNIPGMCYYDWKEFDSNNNIIDQNGLTGTEGLLNINALDYQEFKKFYYNDLYINGIYSLNNLILPNKIPKIAFTFWHGIEFSYLHYLSVESFCFYNRGYEFIIYTINNCESKTWIEGELSLKINCENYFNKIYILQKKYNIKIINLNETIYTNYCPNIISDLVRWNKLYEHGGIWLDLDILHLKPIEKIFDNVLSNCNINNIDFLISNYKNVNGVTGFTKWFPCGILMGSTGNNICKKIIKIMYKEYDPLVYNSVGPNLAMKLFKNVDYFLSNYINVAIFEPEIVYPYVWYQTENYFNIYNIVSEKTVALHWYNGAMNSRKYINKIHEKLDNDKSFFTNNKSCIELYINKFLNEKRIAFKVYKICLVIDAYGWAHNIMANNIKKVLQEEHLIFIYTTQELINEIIYNDFDIKVIDVYLLLNSYDPNILSNTPTLNSLLPKEKVAHWICDYSSWINHPDKGIMNNGRKMLLDTINNSTITLNMCDRIINYLHEINVYPKNIFDLGYLIDYNMFKFNEYNYEDLMYKPKLNIGWAGNASPHCHGWLKGLDNIKNVINRNNDKFNLIYHNKFENNDIKYEDMPNFYKNIDIYICFSAYEAGPQTIYEASSSGRAWISTDVGNINKLLQYNNCGLIINRTELDLENALLDLYYNRNKIIELGQNARSVIENNFNYYDLVHKCFNKIFDILY